MKVSILPIALLTMALNGCCGLSPHEALPSSTDDKAISDYEMGQPDTDGTGLPDWWQFYYFGHLGNNPNSRPNGKNGMTLLEDYLYGINPDNYYRQFGADITPKLAIAGGNNQFGPVDTFLDQPLTVKVCDLGDHPLKHAPIVFSVARGGKLSESSGSQSTTSITVNTDSTGTAQIYYAGSRMSGTSSLIQAAAAASTVTSLNRHITIVGL